jgi:hypothetical protein
MINIFTDKTEISFVEVDEEFIPTQGTRFDTTNETQNIPNMEILNTEVIEPEINLDTYDKAFIPMKGVGFDLTKRVDYIEAQTYPELPYFSDENVETPPPLESTIKRSAHYAMPLHDESWNKLNVDFLKRESNSYLDIQDEGFIEEDDLNFGLIRILSQCKEKNSISLMD